MNKCSRIGLAGIVVAAGLGWPSGTVAHADPTAPTPPGAAEQDQAPPAEPLPPPAYWPLTPGQRPSWECPPFAPAPPQLWMCPSSA